MSPVCKTYELFVFSFAFLTYAISSANIGLEEMCGCGKGHVGCKASGHACEYSYVRMKKHPENYKLKALTNLFQAQTTQLLRLIYAA